MTNVEDIKSLIMKTVLFCLLLLFSTNSYSQYIVTKVNGTVKKKNTGEVLKTGSKFNNNELLAFSSPNDMVRAIVGGKGVFVLTPSPAAEKSGSIFLEIVNTTLNIKSKEGNLSGRGMSHQALPEALITNSSINSKNLIAPENKYLIDTKRYPLTNGNAFFIQVEVSGGSPVIQPLKTTGDTLIICDTDFKIPANNSSSVKYSLGFFSKENDKSELIAQVKPYFDTTNQMENIIKVFIYENKNFVKKANLEVQCYAEICEALAKPADITFEYIFNNIFFDLSKDNPITK